MGSSLPEQFAEFEEIAHSWALETENERHARRLQASSGELREIYDKILPRLEEMLLHLDQFPLGQLPQEELKLLHLTLSMANIGLHIENFRGSVTVPNAFDERRFENDFGDRATIATRD